eukprot:19214-Heterococcus_DN1.PRE.4
MHRADVAVRPAPGPAAVWQREGGLPSTTVFRHGASAGEDIVVAKTCTASYTRTDRATGTPLSELCAKDRRVT